jgi:pSer/pThr/pTyr-binding forkhead associated (FHA) protein
MNPLAAGSNAAAGSSNAPRPSVTDQLRAVDTSVLDRLVSIRQEEAQLDDFRSRAEGRKGDVSEAVYRRVIDDYAKRSATLEQQALPLRSKARTEYRKLRQLVDHISRVYEQAKLEKEELEFRHAVGELDDDRVAEQLQSPQRVLDECRADMTCIDEHKARFIEALGSESALESGPLEAPEAAALAGGAKRAETAPVVAAAPVAQQAPAASAPIGSTPPPSTSSSDATMMVAADETRMIAPSAVSLSPSPDDTSEGQTILVPLAALISESESLPQKEYRLGAVNYLGRAEDNQVQITSPGVSRKHAVIMAAPRGFAVKDLGSQNGIAVNGERVTERTLADGDRVEIGGVSFVFRSPWPILGAAKAATGPTARPGAKSR